VTLSGDKHQIRALSLAVSYRWNDIGWFFALWNSSPQADIRWLNGFRTSSETTRKKRGGMKLSIEAKVAAAVAASFVALTLGAIAQGNSGSQTGRPDRLADNPRISTYVDQQGLE
jgi:hypothetical protein